MTASSSDEDALALQRRIEAAERLLPGTPAPEDTEDPRWQAIIAVGDYAESHPEEVWRFVQRWGINAQDDLRMAIATCLLEHLLEYHFDLIFPRVMKLTQSDPLFADTFSNYGKMGQAEAPVFAAMFEKLERECRNKQ